MELSYLSDRLALYALALALGACSDHHVSPWGVAGRPTLAAFTEQPSLDQRLAAIDAEARGLGLAQTIEVRGELAGGRGPVVVRGYAGAGALGRTVHAVRAATGRALVLALGPPDDRAFSDPASELVPFLVPGPSGGIDGSAFRAATDLTGDATPDIVVKNRAGELEVWQLEELGAHRYDVVIATPVLEAGDADADGRMDLGGAIAVGESDPIRPELRDWATFDGARFSNATPAVHALHERALAALAPPKTTDGEPSIAPSGSVRLRRALERAWHRILAGHPRDAALADLDRETPSPAHMQSFTTHRHAIAGLAR